MLVDGGGSMLDGALAQSLLAAMSEAVYVVDTDRTITFWNEAAEAVTGYSAAEVVGRRCRDGLLNHVDDQGTALCGNGCPLVATMADGAPRQASVYLHHRDGHRLPVTVRAAALRDENGLISGAVEVFHDDTRYRELEARHSAAEQLSLTDPLTGLGNRRSIQQALRRECDELRRYDRRFAVLFLDIDQFKSVNDRYGHDTGDDVLRLVAATLASCTRASDVVGRWGGEEFVVIAAAADGEPALEVAERIRRLIAQAWLDTPDGQQLRVTVSIGVAPARAGESPRSLVDRADRAMLIAKRAGRNAVSVS
jgi:diguanylate cyclase (GGDEF)-like protein/PAS domain S-box-containing protein